ncbi:MAG TPA: hypothetical protein VNI02_12595, partial [Blastocatellia bacterium]|nr:hypothetical protein [Blastocatellia bacterium]
MNLDRLFCSFALAVFLVSTVAAQTPSQDSTKSDKTKADQEKAQEILEKKSLALLDEVLKEAPTLRLAENRIRIQALAADLLWSRDEKRARALFKQVTDGMAELLADEYSAASPQTGFITDGPVPFSVGRYPGLLQARVQLRHEILQLLTNRDARLARDFLLATGNPGNRENLRYRNMGGDAEMDLNLAVQMATNDPKQALQIAEEHLGKGLPYGLANVLTQLQNKDPEAAAKLAAGIMKRLRSENIATNREAATLALMLIGQEGEADERDSSSNEARSVSKNQQALNEKVIRELLDMVLTAALNQPAKKSDDSEGEDQDGQPPLVASLEALMPKVEKYAPSRAPALRKKIAEYESALPPQARAYKEYEAVLQTGDSQALMDAAAKASPQMKDMLVMQAIMKAAGDEQFDRARQMIDEHVKDAGQRKQMLANIDRQVLQRASMQGKLDEARPLLLQLPPEERATLLAQFAVAAVGRGDKKLGLQILDEARSYLGAQAENHTELGALLQLARTYAPIEPARSFDIIEPTVEQL